MSRKLSSGHMSSKSLAEAPKEDTVQILDMRPRVTASLTTLTPLQSLIVRRWRPQWICQSCAQQRQPQRRRTSTTAKNSTNAKPYYITTPIFYVNAAPHVGHMYTMILTDVLARWQRLHNRTAILCTGTDEHGLKVQRAAAKANVDPQEFCDSGAEVFRELAEKIDISNDIFIRTTDKKHKEAVEYAWQELERKGYIYESKHEGWYSVSDETFFPQGQVHLIVDPPTGRKIMVSVETGREVEWASERNYHFRLSAFRERLLEFYKSNPEFVVPRTRMQDVVREVEAGSGDLSVSRPVERLTWGVRVPGDASQTMYVWLDALLNYATAAGYPFTPGAESAGGWPADVHVIGKDIIRFHCIYWPAFLMALDLPLPKQVLTTAHWTMSKKKMSKTEGNVVNPFFALERFGTDAMRWYLVHDGGITDDADYDNYFIYEKYRKGLQGGLGNLASRIVKGRGWSVREAVQRFASSNKDHGTDPPVKFREADRVGPVIYEHMLRLPGEVGSLMDELLPNKALQRIMQAVYDSNYYLQQSAPWLLAKARHDAINAKVTVTAEGYPVEFLKEDIDRIVFVNVEALRMVGIMFQAFIPSSANKLLDMLGVAAERRNCDYCAIGKDDSYGTPLIELVDGDEGQLFPRLGSGP